MSIIYLLAGALLGALFVTFAARLPGGGRNLLAIGLFIAGTIYVLVALHALNREWMITEAIGALACGLIGWLGVRHSPLWLTAGWGLHPLWDIGLHLNGPGATIAPAWYALLCVSFDMVVAGYVWLRLRPASAHTGHRGAARKNGR